MFILDFSIKFLIFMLLYEIVFAGEAKKLKGYDRFNTGSGSVNNFFQTREISRSCKMTILEIMPSIKIA